MARKGIGNREGQATIDYVFLVVVVAAAMVAMHGYASKAMQANLKNLELELNEITEAK